MHKLTSSKEVKDMAMADLRERLMRYEDTDLAPGQMLEIDKMYQELSREVMAYRKIGTVEECQEALEKHRAEKPQLIGDGVDNDGNMIYDMYDCPDCGTRYEIDYEKYNFCPNCGKAIDWSGKE